MRWVKFKLMPTFKEKFPGKIMIPCCDNAPYHHNRGVPSLSGIGKKADLIELIRNGTPGATTDNGGFTGLPQGATIRLPADGKKRDVDVHVDVHGEDIAKDAKVNLPGVPTIAELKTGFIEALQSDTTLRQHLECKLEAFITAENKKINPHLVPKSDSWAGGSWMLWTPPYSPTLQPIEEFWAAGKNYAASQYTNGRSMKQCVRQLQAGWYGDEGTGEFKNKERTKPKEAVDCEDLVRRAMAEGSKKARLVGGLIGTVETGLQHDGDHKKHPLIEGDGDTDMSVKHIELVDLTVPDGTEADPLTLTEEEHEEELARHVEEGGELEVVVDDAELQLG